MRLIDADELKKECYSVPDPKGRYAELRIIEDYEIDDAPTIFDTDDATNGDVIMAMFPNVSVYEHNGGATYSVNNVYNFNATWWNAPYQQKGGKD